MRYIWLAVFLLVTSVALADSVDYQGSGLLSNGTAMVQGKLKAGHTWGAQDQLVEIDDLTTHKITSGMLGSIDIVTGTLFKCAAGLCFHGGLVDIDGTKNNSIFDHSLVGGSISFGKGFDILSARMSNGAAVVIKGNRSGAFSTQVLASSAHVVPEPASLGLLGTGLLALGLARAHRSKFNRPPVA